MPQMGNEADLRKAAREAHMDRRIIHVESLPDQAGIAAALRRAFTAGPPREDDSGRIFDDLLRRLH
jgi:hypothetical protein